MIKEYFFKIFFQIILKIKQIIIFFNNSFNF